LFVNIKVPFETGGVHEDKIRNICGVVGAVFGIAEIGGAFEEKQGFTTVGASSGYAVRLVDFNSSRVVPTGAENSPRALSVNYWRRVS